MFVSFFILQKGILKLFYALFMHFLIRCVCQQILLSDAQDKLEEYPILKFFDQDSMTDHCENRKSYIFF